jgi:hypothetical protein
MMDAMDTDMEPSLDILDAMMSSEPFLGGLAEASDEVIPGLDNG